MEERRGNGVVTREMQHSCARARQARKCSPFPSHVRTLREEKNGKGGGAGAMRLPGGCSFLTWFEIFFENKNYKKASVSLLQVFAKTKVTPAKGTLLWGLGHTRSFLALISWYFANKKN